jgi:hypothetical protein
MKSSRTQSAKYVLAVECFGDTLPPSVIRVHRCLDSPRNVGFFAYTAVRPRNCGNRSHAFLAWLPYTLVYDSFPLRCHAAHVSLWNCSPYNQPPTRGRHIQTTSHHTSFPHAMGWATGRLAWILGLVTNDNNRKPPSTNVVLLHVKRRISRKRRSPKAKSCDSDKYGSLKITVKPVAVLKLHCRRMQTDWLSLS